MSDDHMGCTTFYLPEKAQIRFSGKVDADRIFYLCDEIDFSINDYHYRRVQLQIDSPGGEVRALNYFIDRLAHWRAKGVVIETQALTHCCSAGGFMLSLGDLGHRTALPDSLLLFHNVRTATGDSAMTVEKLDSLRWNLSMTDYRMLLRLLRHQHGPQLAEELFEQLKELVCCLPDRKQSVNRQAIERFGVARSRQMLQQIEACGSDEERLRLRRELYRLLVDQLRSWCKPGTHKELDALQRHLAGKTEQYRRNQLLAWLFNRLEEYLREFSKDEYIRPEQAVRLGLIDRIEQGGQS